MSITLSAMREQIKEWTIERDALNDQIAAMQSIVTKRSPSSVKKSSKRSDRKNEAVQAIQPLFEANNNLPTKMKDIIDFVAKKTGKPENQAQALVIYAQRNGILTKEVYGLYTFAALNPHIYDANKETHSQITTG